MVISEIGQVARLQPGIQTNIAVIEVLKAFKGMTRISLLR